MTITAESLLWVLPGAYLAASLVAWATPARAWAVAQAAAAFALLSTTPAAIWSIVGSAPPDRLGASTAVLIALLGWVITHFSRRYLEGEPGQLRFVIALLATLSAVGTVVLTRNLAVLVVAWSFSSLGLHHLLTFHRDRAPAQIVAHKKFLVSRTAEICLVAALALIHAEAGTLDLAGIATHIASLAMVPWALHGAAVLVALAVLLKSAQLPLHGWLIQVMEAPTPVSALLHAGIVNIGGFVILRLAPLVSASPAAQTLLVIVGTLTAVLASLVMMTRISIKVRLAWSTCAQMGFMLMECGLGLYELAFLHLIAHSLYKAYSFLTAGEAVAQAARTDMTRGAAHTTAGTAVLRRAAALPVSLALVAGSFGLWRMFVPELSIEPVALGIVAIGLSPLLWQAPGNSAPGLARPLVSVLGLTQLYVLWHLAFAQLAPAGTAPALPLALCTAVAFATLYLLQVWLLAYPRGALSAALYPLAYAGFHLDERATRLTFRVWPARLPAGRSPHSPPSRPSLAGEKA